MQGSKYFSEFLINLFIFNLLFSSNLTQMFKKALRNFYKMTGHKPVSLIFFRPGTNEHEVKRITYIELSAIRAACKELADDYRFASIDIISIIFKEKFEKQR